VSNRNVDFVGKRKMAAVISVSLIVIGILAILIQGGLNYNIEFNGGTLVQVGFKEDVKINEIRDVFSKTNLHGVQLQTFSDESTEGDFKSEVVIKLETMEENIKDVEKTIIQTLDNSYGKSNYIIRQTTSIGPKIGDELKTSALQAIFYALLGILIYITFKFEFKYAVAAIIALFHDVFITVGVFSILGLVFDYEISLSVIAALMTIVGYSLNDTIVVFDRIRENKNKLEGMELTRLVNVSLNETLTRTLLTSLTTLFVVLVLFIFGGEVIRDLSATLLIGVLIGTYSSIFVASPVVIWWDNKKKLEEA